MPWQQLSVITSERTAAEISALFSALGAVSVTYMDAADQPVYEPEPGETKIWTKTKVIALFERNIETDLVKSVIRSHFDDALLEDWRLEQLQDQAWERAWMEYYQPMKFGNRLWICPTGQQRQEPETVCLTLDPGLAFGTGTHPTTALCLEWLAENDLTGQTVIDYGCGSGILAIAALLLGAETAFAIDIDPQALTATMDNAKKNNVQHRINCCVPEQFSPIEADFLLANILAQPLIELAPKITELLKPCGRLVLSGILRDQADKVIAAYTPHLHLSPAVIREEWCRIDGYKP